MFSLNSKITGLNDKPEDVVTVISSSNHPFVAVAGPAQQANAFIISTKDGKKRSVFICFHIIPEARLIFYTYDKGAISESKMRDVEDEALEMVEEMGFVMVKERFPGRSVGKRGEFISNLPPFISDTARLKKWGEPSDEPKISGIPPSEDDYYEEVMEEVYEEVEVDDEGDDEGDEEEREEEYENLDDIVDSIDDYEDVETGDQGEFDLGSEISGEVESIKEDMPVAPESIDKSGDISSGVERASGAERGDRGNFETPREDKEFEKREDVSEKPAETKSKKTSDTIDEGKGTEFFIEEKYMHLVRLLMSL